MDWWGRGRPVFFDPRGGTHFEGRWQPPVNDEGFSEEGFPEAGVSAETSGREKRLKRAETEDLAEVLAEDLPTKNSRRGGVPEDLIQNLAPEDRRWGRVPEDLVRNLLRENRRQDIVPDGRTPSARWKRESDIPDRVYFRALEAIQEGGR